MVFRNPTGLQATLRPYQEVGATWLKTAYDTGSGAVLGDDMGTGKGQVLSEPVLTPQGWRPIGNISAGDAIIGSDGKAHAVVGVYPQGVKKLFKLTTQDDRKTTVSEDHLWAVQSPVQKFRSQGFKVLPTTTILARGLQEKSGNSKWFIPVVAPVDFPEQKQLPLHPYLLGALLANGYFGAAIHHSGDEQQRTAFSPFLPSDITLTPTNNKWDWTLSCSGHRNSLQTALRELGLAGGRSNDKFVPQPYLLGSVAQRLALLQGLCDNDGTVSKDGMVVEYNTVSPVLATNVIELVRSLGGVAQMSTRMPKYRHKGELRVGQMDHRIRIKLPACFTPVSIPRKVERFVTPTKYPPAVAIASIEPAGEAECVCIAVDAPDHLYVTKDYIVTHNTLQTLTSVMLARQELHPAAPPLHVLVVAPTSVTTNWVRELAKFAPGLTVHLWQGQRRQEDTLEALRAEVLVASYALLRLDEAFFLAQTYSLVVLDEAQYIKNPESATAATVKRLHARRRLALTGTPVENRLTEVWSIFDFAVPGLLGPLNVFRRDYAKPIEDGDESAAESLRAIIRPRILRRTKQEVAKDLPKKVEVDLPCALAERQAAAYRRIHQEVRDQVMGRVEKFGMASSHVQILAGLTRLRQASCDLRLLKGEKPTKGKAYGDEDSGKLEVLRELITEAVEGGHKVLVFSQFVSMLKIIEAALKKDRVLLTYLDGTTKDRAERVEAFQKPKSKIAVFLISLKAGGTGLNLTAADTVVHFDPWWNPAVEAQATDRAHRIGQARVVTAYRFIAEGTIEEKIQVMQGFKRELAESILTEGGVRKLTREDLVGLFGD